jgi:hypothetical protein
MVETVLAHLLLPLLLMPMVSKHHQLLSSIYSKRLGCRLVTIVHNPTSVLHNVTSFGVIYTAPTTDVWHKIIHKRSSLKEKHKDYW